MKRLMSAWAVVLMLVSISQAAWAKYPERSITIVVPYAPGGGTDLVARTLGEAIKQVTGQSVVVDNKPGAGGVIAIEELAKAEPDGYTLMVGNVTTSAITPVVFRKNFSINYEEKIAPVARIALQPSLLVSTTGPGGVKSLKELIETAKAKPGSIRYSSAGIGSYPHFDMELLALASGMKLVHIPTSAGAKGIMQGLLNGDTHISWLNVTSAQALIGDGKLVALATNSKKRLPELPDVATMVELGYPDIGTDNWQAMFAPAGMKAATLAELQSMLDKVIQQKVVQDTFAKSIMQPSLTSSPDEARAWINAEIEHWKKVSAKVPLK